MATLSAEDVLTRFQALEASYNDLLQRVAVSETQHQATHQHLEASKAQAANLQAQLTNTGKGGKGGFRLIDPKTMVPERLSNRDQWRGWAEQSRSYIENLNTRLAELLKQTEGRSEPLTEGEIGNLNLD